MATGGCRTTFKQEVVGEATYRTSEGGEPGIRLWGKALQAKRAANAGSEGRTGLSIFKKLIEDKQSWRVGAVGSTARAKVEKVVRDQVRQSLEAPPKEAAFYSKYDRKPLKHFEKVWQTLPTPSIAVTAPDPPLVSAAAGGPPANGPSC